MAYPLVLTNLAQMRCVIVGGGAVAERKALGLLEGGARPELISPALTPGLAALVKAGRAAHQARPYQEGDLHGAWLAIAATNSREVNGQVAEDGRRLGILVNVADAPDEGNFHTVGAVRRGDLLLTVSTGGASPSLAANIRRELEAAYGQEYAALLEQLRHERAKD